MLLLLLLIVMEVVIITIIKHAKQVMHNTIVDPQYNCSPPTDQCPASPQAAAAVSSQLPQFICSE